MRAGTLRHRVTIEAPIDTVSESGAIGTDYVPWLVRIRAHVLPASDMSHRETYINAQIASQVDTKIRIRYREGMTAKMRVRQDIGPGSPTRRDIWDIIAVVPADSMKAEMWLYCRKRSAQGYRSGT